MILKPWIITYGVNNNFIKKINLNHRSLHKCFIRTFCWDGKKFINFNPKQKPKSPKSFNMRCENISFKVCSHILLVLFLYVVKNSQTVTPSVQKPP